LQYKRIKRQVHGVLLLDKPSGISSNQALQQAKRLYQAAKAGHTGSLDPLATGLLPVCFGEATKFSHYLLDADKSYRAVIKLGVRTTTGDAEGEVVQASPVQVSPEQIEAVLTSFSGPIAQVPPMYSALKHQGKPLYAYARDGVDIQRAARQVVIHAIRLLRFARDELEIEVDCSKGTYIRTLAEDIGNALGCGGHLKSLRRLATGHFRLKDALTLEQLETMSAEERDRSLLPVDASIAHLPQLALDEASAHYLQQGQRVWKSGVVPAGLFRIYNAQGAFMGMGEQMPDGRIAPKRLMQLD
jgi:tRNA pseudouridine55 synthase